MDGYAVRRAELGGVPLPVALRIAAGDPPALLPPGCAAAISTGAAVPEGADAIVPVEDAEERAEGLVAPPPRGTFIRPAGGDLRAGDPLGGAGVVLGAGLLSALAAAGVERVPVARRPRVAAVVTGSELVPPGVPLRPGQIHESNSVGLAALAARAGAGWAGSTHVADDPDETERALAAALAGADLVVTSGGVSVGPHDHVKPALRRLGVREVFWRIAHKPGKPLWFGVAAGGSLVFGLPGNPVSSLVCFELFVRPALTAMQGAAQPARPVARLAHEVAPLETRDHAMRCRLRAGSAGMELAAQDAQDSHLIAHAASADALALIPAGREPLPAGALVEYLPL
jgi:molybdopterin molybdotransferase